MKVAITLHKRRVFLFVCCCLFSILTLHAQQFSTQGSAVQSGPLTYAITQDVLTQAGMITNYYPVDLSKNFSIRFQLNFGIKDAAGADGFAFLLNNSCQPTFTTGSGLGVSGITNSLIVEFDTWDNGAAWNDISQDHTGIYADGQLNSGGVIADGASPVCLTGTCANVEDGLWHDVTIEWEYLSATSQRLTVFFDNEKRITSTRNHLQERFNNNAIVFWSVAASTGGNSNLQQLRVEPSSNNVINACVGKSFTLIAPSPGTNYSWSKGSSNSNAASFITSVNETITCTYTDYCGAQRSVNFTIIANQIPAVAVNSINACELSSVQLTATPTTADAYSFVWTVPPGASNPGNVQSFSPTVSGTYSVVATNTVTSCITAAATTTVVLQQAANPLFVLPDTICKSDALLPFALTSVNGITGTWSPAPDNQRTTTYTFTPNATDCALPFSKTIVVKTIPVVQARFDSVLCLGDAKLLHPKATGSGLSYLWSTGSTDSVLSISTPGNYTVAIANSCGSVNALFAITQVVCKVFIPTAFTPNDDGLNDRFAILGAAYVSKFSMQIFNRYGQLIFESTNPFTGWDGRYKGLQQDAGSYVYRISYVNLLNEKFEQQGLFRLVR